MPARARGARLQRRRHATQRAATTSGDHRYGPRRCPADGAPARRARGGQAPARDRPDPAWRPEDKAVDYVAESNVVDRQIRNLRAQLQDDWREPRFITTAPGRG